MSRENSQVLLASAGTGKTFELTNRLLALYCDETPLERVLASTFTRKAAGEILERLVGRLCAASESEEKSRELALQAGVELDRVRATRLCVRLLRHIDRLRISTLDAWFKQQVEQASLDFGLPPDWEVCDPQMEQRLCGRALSRALDRPRSQLEWSTLISDLKRGGAESRVHAGLAASLARAGRFARECTAEAWDFPASVADISPEDFDRARLALEQVELPLTQAGKPRKSFQTALAHLDQALRQEDWLAFASLTLVTRVLENELVFDSSPIPESLAQALRSLARRAAHHAALGVRAQNRALRSLAGDFLEELEAAALEERRLAFDALPRLLEARGGDRHLSAGIDHLLLDEFQDTSSLQWRALESTVLSALERPQASFFCVGDVKQSIYAWREGNPLLLAQLAPRLSLPVRSVAQNRRSSQVVLDFVNLVFESIDVNLALAEPQAREASRRFRSGFESHWTEERLEGGVCVWAGPEVEDARIQKPREDARLERAVAVAAELAAAHPQWSVAFLLRNTKLIPALLERLKSAGLDASGEGGNPLTDSSAVNAALSLLEFVDHPDDDFLAFHVQTSPLAEHAGLAACGIGAAKQRREASLALRRRWLALGPAGFLAELEGIVREHYGAFDQRRFAQLLALAQRLRPSERLRPARFSERLAQERVPDPAGSRLRVMTVHGAKGLEFDAVILPDLDTPLNKHQPALVAFRRDGDPRAPYDVVTHGLSQEAARLIPELGVVQAAAKTTRLHEELCVLYVALTRAVHRLELVIDYPGRKYDKCTFAGIVLQALGVDEVRPSSRVGEEFETRPAAQAESRPETAVRTRAPRAAEPAQSASRPIHLAPGARSLAVAPSRAASDRERRPSLELFQRPEAARRRGRLWHAWLERVGWSEDPLPAAPVLLEWARESARGEVELGEAEDWLCALRQEVVSAELSRARAAERLGAEELELRLLREQRFAFLAGSGARRELVHGAIDRAVVSRAQGRAEIVDFKSDPLPAADDAALREQAAKHRPQMLFYRTALARLEGIDESRIELRLCFLAAGRSITIA